MDALVTGASGFIGTHLVHKLLAEGRTVRVYVRPGSPRAQRMRELDVEFFEGDLADGAALDRAAKGVRTIFHAGAAMDGSWVEHEQTTVAATATLADAALAYGAERMVFVSSIAVFEAEGPEIDETSPYKSRPREMGPYAWSKIEAERRLLSAHRERDLPVTIVRPGIVLGPFGLVLIPHLGFRYRNWMFTFGRGDNRLPLTYVDNTVAGIILAARHPAAVGQSYNLVDDGAVTVRDYLTRFREVTGERLGIVRLPVSVPYLAAAMCELAAALRLLPAGGTSRRRMRAKHHSIVFSNARAKSELGWAPDVPLDEGIDRTFRWYRERGQPRSGG